MNTKHFIKTLLIFSGMILLGLLAVYISSYFDKDNTIKNPLNSATVAK